MLKVLLGAAPINHQVAVTVIATFDALFDCTAPSSNLAIIDHLGGQDTIAPYPYTLSSSGCVSGLLFRGSA